MRIITCPCDTDTLLEDYRPEDDSASWELVISGFWAEDMYHSGYIAYYIAKLSSDCWVMDSLSRNAELDGVTQDDVDQERLNDDQWQLLDGTTLEEAQSVEYRRIVAVCTDAPKDATSSEMAPPLYEEVCRLGWARINEPDEIPQLLI